MGTTPHPWWTGLPTRAIGRGRSPASLDELADTFGGIDRSGDNDGGVGAGPGTAQGSEMGVATHCRKVHARAHS
jgi:hypothetical protein